MSDRGHHRTMDGSVANVALVDAGQLFRPGLAYHYLYFGVLHRCVLTRSCRGRDLDALVTDAIATMLSHHIGGLPVVNSAGMLVGILSESDFLRRAELGTLKKPNRWLALLASTEHDALDFARQHGRRVRQVMSPDPIAIAEDTSLEKIVQLSL